MQWLRENAFISFSILIKILLLNDEVYIAFAEGYGGLPSDWLRLAKLADIPIMLGLLNIDTAPQEWVSDIEHDVMEAIR